MELFLDVVGDHLGIVRKTGDHLTESGGVEHDGGMGLRRCRQGNSRDAGEKKRSEPAHAFAS